MRPFFEAIAPEAQILNQLASTDLTPHLIELYQKQPEEARKGMTQEHFLDLTRYSHIPNSLLDDNGDVTPGIFPMDIVISFLHCRSLLAREEIDVSDAGNRSQGHV